ncbi:hypothetical protein AB0H57_31885 [Micromonospora sp. NPDC050686]|uniref:hypothetical protein n=1 Tax=Micromonospora sp. NPDC050686 TaxID=3154631 RepID=UPI0034003881
MGLRNLPSKAWTVNQGRVLTCNIAADLTVWMRLLGLHDQPDLAHAEPGTLRYRLLHLPAKLATHPRPPPRAVDPRHLALGRRVPALLAAPHPATTDNLTPDPCTYQQKDHDRGPGDL